MNEPLTDRFRPETFDDVQGNNKSLKEIRSWAENWSPGDPALFLHGPPGVGKSSTAFVIADTQDWHLHDVNASDTRTTEDLESIVREAKTVPPDGYQLLFIDEIDNLHSATNTDALAGLLSSPPNPVVLAANDAYEVPHALRQPCREHEFKLGKRSRRAKLNEIVEAEGFDLDSADIDSLADRPDLRSAINDLQASLNSEVTEDSRYYEDDPFEAVRLLLTGHTDFNVDETPDSFLHWLDQNWRSDLSSLGRGSKDLRGIEIPLAFDALSLSDLYLDHARRSDYRFWKYASALQSRTANLRQTTPFNERIAVDFPEWYQLSSDTPTDDSPEAALYRELSHYESGMPGLSGNYYYFRETVLPLLLDRDAEQLIQLCIDYGLSNQAVKGLGLTQEQISRYKGDTDWEEHEQTRSVLSEW